MKTLLIYLRNVKKPFEVCFESKIKLEQFYLDLANPDMSIVRVGPFCFTKSEFRFCLQK